MKLEDQVLQIKNVTKNAHDEKLSRSGLLKKKKIPIEDIPPESISDRNKLESLIDLFLGESKNYESARSKLIEELAFTLFNQIAALKVMESKGLIIETILQRPQNAGLSFAHMRYISENPDKREESFKGLKSFLESEFEKLGKRINLYSSEYPFNILPESTSLKKTIDEFNKIDEKDLKSDDFLGFCYEYYNRDEKKLFKESGEKIEYGKVSLSSQIYTPSWVVEFILNNSLGKLWMEMHPDSSMKNKRGIAHIPDEPVRDRKPVEEIKFIDPCCGSGNFFQTAFDLFFEMYKEEGYKDKDIPEKILANNLYGIDLDDRAVQIAHLGLFIKSLEKNPDFSISKINIVSTDFHLPEFEVVKDIFIFKEKVTYSLDEIKEIWGYLRQAENYGSLIEIKSKILPHRPKGQQSIISEDLEHKEEHELFNLVKTAFQQFGNGNSRSFIMSKTEQGLSFVEIISQKYDIAALNPPYTESGSYGPQLKGFVRDYYKNGKYSFYPNLYACFLKRGTDLINDEGKVGIIHPLPFMFIKTFEGMRRYILDKYHINVFVEFGLGDTFGSIMVDPAVYVIEKIGKGDSLFISLNQYTRTPEEKFKKSYMEQALKDFIQGKQNIHNYILDQEKLKMIDGWPFIYWITNELRIKFNLYPLKKHVDIKTGLSTGDNIRFLRYWWEIDLDTISSEYTDDHKKWVPCVKGGEYRKWYGNLWLVLNWEGNGEILKQFSKSTIRNKKYYFMEGITSIKSSTKGNAFRYLPENHIFTDASPSFFVKKDGTNDLYFLLGFLNSLFSDYSINCLNPTVNTQVGDLERIPFIIPDEDKISTVSICSHQNVKIQKNLCEFSFVEQNYKHSPITWAKDNILAKDYKESTIIQKAFQLYLSYENSMNAQILINESIINKIIFECYKLGKGDLQLIVTKEGVPAGSLPLLITEATQLGKLKEIVSNSDNTKKIVAEFIDKLKVQQIGTDEWKTLIQNIEKLYERSESIEDISLKLKVNPLTVISILKDSNVLPKNKSQRIAQEFVLDRVRSILIDDDDGIIPLHPMTGESTVCDRLIEKLFESGYSQKDIHFLETLLNKKLDEYLESNFFADECDILNKFMYLPKTPFIWHLSSGKAGGIDLFIIIYKWSRDKLLKVKSVYAQKRKTGLENRLAQLSDSESIKVDEEKEAILEQLMEIYEFCKKIDKILSEGYDPVLDDGVGKNIATLQNEGILKINVLALKELKNFLNAEW